MFRYKDLHNLKAFYKMDFIHFLTLLLTLAAVGCKSADPVYQDTNGGNNSRQPAVTTTYNYNYGTSATTLATSPNWNTTTTNPLVNTAGSFTTSTLQNTQSYLTNGSGGPTGGQEQTSQSRLRYIVSAPAGNQPRGLLVTLHGSSASSYREFPRMMQSAMQQHNLMLVSVLAPNGSGWNEGGEQQAANSLDSLIRNEIFRGYNIDTRKVFFSGQSSGAGFLATHFVAMHGQNYQGGAFLLCGCQPPQVNIAVTPAMRTNFKMYIELTTNDGIWDRFQQSTADAYRQAGVSVESIRNRPGGHCDFNQGEIVRLNLGRMLVQGVQ
jgi:hypothetical protein